MMKFFKKKYLLWIVGVVLALGFMFLFLIAPPVEAPTNAELDIAEGETLSDVADNLFALKLIRSPLLFKILVQIVSPRHGVIAGNYKFDQPENILTIVSNTTDFLAPPSGIRVTVIEGMNNKQIGDMLAKKLSPFDEKLFLEKAAPLEGYLFPDTYIFPKGITETEVIDKMHDNFMSKTQPLLSLVLKSGRPIGDIVTMASIVEREARTADTRQTVAGILWKRIDSDMRLQVDAVFYYLYGASSSEITMANLAVDSPYNTYKYKGLPPGPIGNPGLLAIKDVLSPKDSPYWFYLSDKKGAMHYAATYDTHLANKRKYLD
jgi:UPF0755 protein